MQPAAGGRAGLQSSAQLAPGRRILSAQSKKKSKIIADGKHRRSHALVIVDYLPPRVCSPTRPHHYGHPRCPDRRKNRREGGAVRAKPNRQEADFPAQPRHHLHPPQAEPACEPCHLCRPPPLQQARPPRLPLPRLQRARQGRALLYQPHPHKGHAVHPLVARHAAEDDDCRSRGAVPLARAAGQGRARAVRLRAVFHDGQVGHGAEGQADRAVRRQDTPPVEGAGAGVADQAAAADGRVSGEPGAVERGRPAVAEDCGGRGERRVEGNRGRYRLFL